MKLKNTVREFAVITFAMLIVSAAVYFLWFPVNRHGKYFRSGAGIFPAHRDFHVDPYVLSKCHFACDRILLIGKDFGAKTIYTSILLPIFLWIFERLIPVTESVTGNQVFDLVTYTLIVALGQAMLFHVNASSGGLDIVAKILNKFAHMELGKAVMLSGFVTAMTSILVYDVPTLIVSLLGTYANGMAVDYFIDGFNKRKRVCIISDDYKEIQNYIIHDLKRGATLYVAQGAYDEKHRTELVTILAQQEYRLLLNYLHTTKKDVFVTVSTVNEVIGQWNAK